MFASKHIAIAAIATLVSCNVFAAGFEKAVLFSGHYGGLGGAGTSDVSGAEAAYFNPAGIGMDHVGHQVQLDVSPTWINSSASSNGSVQDSKGEFLPPYALLYDWTPNEKWGFVVGSYSGAGLEDEYNNIPLGSGATGTYKTNFNEYEFVAGASYKVMPKLKVGVEYRLAYATAELEAARVTAGGLLQQDLRDLSGWTSSWRAGAMWTDTVWGAGVSVRGPADFRVTGQDNTTNKSTTVVTPTDGVTAQTQLPLEVSVGGHYDFMTHLRGYLEYAYTHYGHDQAVIITGDANTASVAQQWSDQHQIRIAGEYSEFAWPIRLGYVYSTRVENKSTYTPNFAPPSDGHTFTVGTGHAFWGHFQGDVAFEYSFSHASDVQGATAITGTNPFKGDDKADVYALHLGLAYNF